MTLSEDGLGWHGVRSTKYRNDHQQRTGRYADEGLRFPLQDKHIPDPTIVPVQPAAMSPCHGKWNLAMWMGLVELYSTLIDPVHPLELPNGSVQLLRRKNAR